jgi:hypothetical protein
MKYAQIRDILLANGYTKTEIYSHTALSIASILRSSIQNNPEFQVESFWHDEHKKTYYAKPDILQECTFVDCHRATLDYKKGVLELCLWDGDFHGARTKKSSSYVFKTNPAFEKILISVAKHDLAELITQIREKEIEDAEKKERNRVLESLKASAKVKIAV